MLLVTRTINRKASLLGIVLGIILGDILGIVLGDILGVLNGQN